MQKKSRDAQTGNERRPVSGTDGEEGVTTSDGSELAAEDADRWAARQGLPRRPGSGDVG